jgi:hypothetical protein
MFSDVTKGVLVVFGVDSAFESDHDNGGASAYVSGLNELLHPVSIPSQRFFEVIYVETIINRKLNGVIINYEIAWCVTRFIFNVWIGAEFK